MEVKGTILSIGNTQEFGSNGFRKRELVVTTQEQYPQSILIEFVQDKVDALNNYEVGQSVEVGINPSNTLNSFSSSDNVCSSFSFLMLFLRISWTL